MPTFNDKLLLTSNNLFIYYKPTIEKITTSINAVNIFIGFNFITFKIFNEIVRVNTAPKLIKFSKASFTMTSPAKNEIR